MTEPTHEVNVDRIFALFGAKVVELNVVQELLAKANARVAELEAKAAEAPPPPPEV